MSAATPAAPVLRFRSTRDAWVSAFLALLLIVCAVSFFSVLRLARAQPLQPIALFAVLSPLLTPALVLWTMGTIAYEISADGLRARCGLLRFRVPFAEIEAVEPKRGLDLEMGWSLALSLDRLLVRRRRGLALAISPESRELFLAELAARCPQLVREGDRLAPRGAS